MKNQWTSLFCILALPWTAFDCWGQSLQPFKFQSFTAKNGLNASDVSCFSEDVNGFLWVATYYGICRFDGFEFKSYRLPIVDTSKISSNNLIVRVQCIRQQVWCLNRYGYFFRLDRSQDTFVYMHLSIDISRDKKFDPRAFDFIFDAKRDCFWVKHTKGIFKYDLSTGKRENAIEFKEAQNGTLLLDTSQRLWYMTWYGEQCYDPETGKNTLFFDKTEMTAHAHGKAQGFLPDF